MKMIILVRHSEPQRLKGIPTEDIPLSAYGESLAYQLFTDNAFCDVTQVYSSPYKRAYSTAMKLGLQPQNDIRLRERELGDKTTLNAEFWERQYTDIDFKNKDGESFREVNVRMSQCIDEILDSMSEGEKVVVVSHAAAICAYLMSFCKIKVIDAERKIREIMYDGKVLLSGKIDTPSAFVLAFDSDNILCKEYISCKNRGRKPDAQTLYELAMKHIYGDGVPEDNELAVKLLTEASDMGQVEAAYNLGICYHYGYGTEINLKRAYELYLESANKGYGKGMELVGRFYNCGIYVMQDRKQAEYWLKKAIESNDPEAVEEAKIELGNILKD